MIEAGGELFDACEQRPRPGHVAVGHEQLGAERVELRVEQAAGDQRLDLGGEGEAVGGPLQ